MKRIFSLILFFLIAQAAFSQSEFDVLARYYDSYPQNKYWYKGKITKKDSEGKFFVEYDDGDSKWHGNYNTLVLFNPMK